MNLKGVALQRLLVECIHKATQHGLLAELGMYTKALHKAAHPQELIIS